MVFKVLLIGRSRYSFPAALSVTEPRLAEPHQEVLLQLPRPSASAGKRCAALAAHALGIWLGVSSLR
jgi:hypothetical protein